MTIFNNSKSKKVNKMPTYKHTKVKTVYTNGVCSKFYDLFWRSIRLFTFRKTYHRTSFIKKCISEIKCDNYDYVLVEGNFTQVLQIKKNLVNNIILHLHTDILNEDTPLAKEIINACDKILVVSNYLEKQIINIDGKNREKIYIFKNAIDTCKFNKKLYSEFRSNYRKEIDVNENEVLIMYCGRLSKEKGVKELLLAFEEVSHLNCKLMVVGSSWFNSSKKNKYVRELEQIAKKFENKVIFTGYIPHEKLPKYYAVADIVAFPSTGNEAAGLVAIESLSSGIPIVTTDLGGIPEYVSKKSSEIINYDKDFVDNLRKSLIKLISDKNHYKSKQIYARESVLGYNLEDYYSNFIKILKGVNL